jgi:serine/threonine protein kinase
METDPLENRKFAVKHFHPGSVDRAHFIHEVELLSRLNHPCVFGILGWSFPTQLVHAETRMEFSENRSLEFVMKWRSSLRFWNPTGKSMIINGIHLGMRFVHSHGILHRDLKPSNILINELGRAMIGDFGSSRLDSDDATWTIEAGTPHYAAPEQYKEEPRTNKVDIFSFGLILYEIVVGSAVFPRSMYAIPVMNMILKGEMPIIPARCGKFMQGLIPRCWAMCPDNRPSFEDIFMEFQEAHFDVLAEADAFMISEYVAGVLAWEIGAASSH